MSACWIVKFFPTKILYLANFDIAYFTVSYNLLSWAGLSGFVTLCRDMESWNTFIQLPIRCTLLKTRIHLKERSYPIYLGCIYRRLYHRHRDQLAAVTPDVNRVLKKAKRCFTKNCYMKLTPAQRCEIYKCSTFTNTL